MKSSAGCGFLDDASPKSLDVLLAASVAWWGVETVCRMAVSGITLAGICVALLHAVVSMAFLVRYPLRESNVRRDYLAALPSLVSGSIAFHAAGSPVHWPAASHAVFCLGAVLASTAVLQLGRSFAVLPHGRPLVSRGVYRVVRHPMYVGEFLMVAACCTAQLTGYSMAVLTLVLPAIVWRIVIEESKLQRFDAHGFSKYTTVARWRLCPLVW